MTETRAVYRVTEHDEQVALFEWASAIPILSVMFAIPNGGARHPATGKRMKAEGVKRGVPDIFLPVARGAYHGLFIELKVPGGRVTPEQEEWRMRLLEQGYLHHVAYGFEDAQQMIIAYVYGEKL